MENRVQCSKCVMDKSASEIVFDANGVCNFCHQAQRELVLIKSERKNLPSIIEKIKADGKGKEYDCLIGLSGGVDSSTVLYQAVKLGLRPLCFSVDNGWNDPRADENIMRLVEGMKVPFFRYTIDLPKFKALQAAFMKAGQINIEIPTDHILMATTYEMANTYKIKWILSGGNVATESIMPPSWGYNARDLVHIKDVYKWATGSTLTGLPLCSLLKWNYYRWIKRVKVLYLLDYLDYNRADSIAVLEKEYGYKSYGDKHCENVFTQWFQNYYLFEKFSIDKRKAHYSSMINSGQMHRNEALMLLGQNPIYPELGLEKRVLAYRKRPYTNFKTDEKLYKAISNFVKLWR